MPLGPAVPLSSALWCSAGHNTSAYKTVAAYLLHTVRDTLGAKLAHFVCVPGEEVC